MPFKAQVAIKHACQILTIVASPVNHLSGCKNRETVLDSVNFGNKRLFDEIQISRKVFATHPPKKVSEILFSALFASTEIHSQITMPYLYFILSGSPHVRH